MQSLLGNFIASLAFSARMWMLVAVSSFRKKFAGILPEKEILGSKRKEGLSQVYARSCLSSWAFWSRHGVFSEMCKHASSSCGYSSEPHDGELKLVVPLSIFMLYCEGMWSRVQNGQGRACPESCLHQGGNCRQSGRRIIPSQEIGINLFGTLKISPASGRLQLSDATGSIDVLIPDLPSTWGPNRIYEVSEYSVIIEGIPQRAPGHSQEHLNESLSCKRIFDCSSLLREMNVGIVIYFHFQNATCRDSSFQSFDVSEDELEDLNGEFLMLQVVHKFPVSQKFPGDLAISERPSAIVEGVVLPWGLFLARKDGGEHFFEAVENLSNNCSQVSRKRQKTERCSPSSGSLDYVSSLVSNRSAFSFSSQDSTISGVADMNSHKIPCLACVRNSNKMVLVSSGILYSMNTMAKADGSCRPSVPKILMEFKSPDMFLYQGLQIGEYCIVKRQRKGSLCTFMNSDSASGLKIVITSKTKLRRLSVFSSDTFLCNGSSCDASSSELHFCTNEDFMRDEMRNPVKASAGYSSVTSDVYLQVCRDLLGPLELDLKKIRCHFTSVDPTFEEVNLSSCKRIGVSLSLFFKASGFAFPFPDGNLTCIRGEVISVHSLKSHGSLVESRNCNEDITSVSIHVLMGNHTVEIFGSLRKHACPIGFGQGVYATFYRILKHSVQNRFMLTPISFIEVDYVRMMNGASLSLHANACSTSDSFVASDAVSSGLISQLVLCSGSKLMRLHCRVIDVSILILERSDSLKSNLRSMAPPQFDIPIAAFVLEDGSSSCVCWADGERASTLLRLTDELPETALGSTYWTLKWTGGGDVTCGSSGYYLGRILKKYSRITMKNYGSLSDSCEDLSFSVSSENILSNSDENLLKSIICTACFGIDWAIVGNVVDLAAVRELQKQHFIQADVELDSFQHLWVREVHYIDPLKEARGIIKQLQTGNSSNG